MSFRDTIIPCYVWGNACEIIIINMDVLSWWGRCSFGGDWNRRRRIVQNVFKIVHSPEAAISRCSSWCRKPHWTSSNRWYDLMDCDRYGYRQPSCATWAWQEKGKYRWPFGAKAVGNTELSAAQHSPPGRFTHGPGFWRLLPRKLSDERTSSLRGNKLQLSFWSTNQNSTKKGKCQRSQTIPFQFGVGEIKRVRANWCFSS